MAASFVPAHYQPDLPLGKLILSEQAGEERIELDVLFVGGGPAGLAGAIELARLVKRERETGGAVGEISIKSRPDCLASCRASSVVSTPICSPAAPMTRTSDTRMNWLTRMRGSRWCFL